MPLSPATRILIALTLLAFPWFFIWLDDAASRVSQTMLGLSLSLMVATIFRVIRDNPAFDDRAFHRTRPNGDPRAFRRSNRTLLGIVAAVSLMAAARSLFYNLGWETTVRSALIVFTQLGLFTAAVGTGFTLASLRAGLTRRVAIVMLGLPAVVYFLMLEWQQFRLRLWPLPHQGEFSTMVGLASAVGLAGFCLTWWMAASLRRWSLALVVAGTIAAYLPLVNGRSMVDQIVAPLPGSTAVLIRNPPEKAADDELDKFKPKGWPYRQIPFDARITTRGLMEDEFIAFTLRVPGIQDARVVRGYRTSNGGGYGGGSGILRETEHSRVTGRLSLLEHLAKRIPGRPELNFDQESRVAGNYVILPNRDGAIGDFEKSSWRIDGLVYRIRDAGNFSLARGGWQRLPGGGTVRVWPASTSLHGMTIDFRTVVPDAGRASVPWAGRGDGLMEIEPRALLVDESGGRAWLPEIRGGRHPGALNQGLASRWQDWKVDWQNKRGFKLSPEQISKTRLYLFFSEPVTVIGAPLPPEH
jgi:hypothetical protein